MLRSSPLASSAENRLLLRITSSFGYSSRLLPLTSDHFNVLLKPQTNHRFLPSLSVASRRFSSPFVYSTRSSRQSNDVEIAKEVTDGGEGVKAEKEVVGVSKVDQSLGFMSVGVANPSFVGRVGLMRMSLGDQAFFLMAFIAAAVCTSSFYFSKEYGSLQLCS